MRITFLILLITLLYRFGYAQCLKQEILDEGFLIKNFEHSEVIDVDEIERLDVFERKFWQKDSLIKDFKFIIPFDFKSGRVSMDSDYGIPVYGLPVGCLYFDCHRRWLTIYLYSKSKFELLNDEGGLEESIIKNITNYGKLPYFSDEPELAYTEIKMLKKFRIKKVEFILSRISYAYIDLIESKVVKENINIKAAIDKYPLKIMFREFFESPKMKKTNLIEVENEIDIDINLEHDN
ncbi:hypothetical protein [Echinicola sp. 20G]|uniref:hypothetical protein n=1 Tax=Echinicola sp. 20G TaxID=2781961 RepID=UPI001910F5C1|nr:hypothetical protein [Echinicola sp. 20G]